MKRTQQYSQIQKKKKKNKKKKKKKKKKKTYHGFTPGVFQGVYFELYISFVHYFGIIIKKKCSPFN